MNSSLEVLFLLSSYGRHHYFHFVYPFCSQVPPKRSAYWLSSMLLNPLLQPCRRPLLGLVARQSLQLQMLKRAEPELRLKRQQKHRRVPNELLQLPLATPSPPLLPPKPTTAAARAAAAAVLYPPRRLTSTRIAQSDLRLLSRTSSSARRPAKASLRTRATCQRTSALRRSGKRASRCG